MHNLMLHYPKRELHIVRELTPDTPDQAGEANVKAWLHATKL